MGATVARAQRPLGPLGPEWKVPSGQDSPTRALTSPVFPQSLLVECDKHRDKTVQEAKVAFLKWICRWPTFGSAFFEVKVGLAPHKPHSG